jgi:hypothetical protein
MQKKFLDLDSLFDWNVKQLFLYLIAEYVTPANVSDKKNKQTGFSIEFYIDLFRVLIKLFYGIK